MRRSGLFGLSDHMKRLSADGDPLEVLTQVIDFEAFRPTLVTALAYSDGAKGGRPPYGPGGHAQGVGAGRAEQRRGRTHEMADPRPVELVTGMRMSVLKFLLRLTGRGVWCDHPGQMHREHESAGRSIIHD